MTMSADLWPSAIEAGQKFGVPAPIHQNDLLFDFIASLSPSRADAVTAYFANGNESAKKLAGLIYNQLGMPRAVAGGRHLKLFEFASGYGMVTRHLPKYLPNFDLLSCDIHPEAVEFVTKTIGSPAVLSQSVPEDLVIDEKADVVFALSFFSHMPTATFGRWLETLYKAVKPGGFFIFTTHGRKSLNTIADDIPEEGYLFQPISEQSDISTSEYGTMFVTVDFVIDEIWKRIGAPLAFYRQAFWWGHQDTYIVARTR